MSLIEESTFDNDRKYVSDDITFAANYLGMNVNNVRFSQHRAVQGGGCSVEVREGELLAISPFTGTYKFYLSAKMIGWPRSVDSAGLCKNYGVGEEPLFQLVEYMYSNER